MCDPSGTGSLTRDGLYKSLALSAVAQEGRAVEERALKSFRDSGEDSRGGRGLWFRGLAAAHLLHSGAAL